MSTLFTRFVRVQCPEEVKAASPDFEIQFDTDGEVPFPQIILRSNGREFLFNGEKIERRQPASYVAKIPAAKLPTGLYEVQIEGCRIADLSQAGSDDWIKVVRRLRVLSAQRAEHADGAERTDEPTKPGTAQITATRPDSSGVKIYFGIHKHMHQPYYRAADPSYWDGEKDGIFSQRGGPYTSFIPTAVRQYLEGGLPHAGLSTSWSGSLVEQLDRCANEGLCGGTFKNWKAGLRELAATKTALGHPRLGFSAFGFFHPLMALIPARDIIRQIEWHRRMIAETFGAPALDVLFPPETAFHVRMIPALNSAGIRAVIYDSIHRFRACRDYPYAGPPEGMLPPNRAEQENPPVNDWLQLHNIWAGSKISPSLLRPEYVKYEDPDGAVHQIIAVPAERYIGNEDARGGFGALQYPDVLNQVREQILATGSFDPAHPPFFLLHSDGDNHGGGSDVYYGHNTGRLVEWLREDSRFELTTVDDYLDRFPPDPARTAHIEPGSWSGADNGDPQFKKWFSRYTEAYSPDLNSWAVLTALQNRIHTLEDAGIRGAAFHEAERLLLTAETSCYWYWTGQEVWDAQVTLAANRALELLAGDLEELRRKHTDKTGPTIFAPWVFPENPGAKTWGNNCLVDAAKTGRVHTFVDDLSEVRRVTLHLRAAAGDRTIEMTDRGTYPSRTGARAVAHLFTADLPAGLGDIRYWIEAEDEAGNLSRGSLERIFLA